MNIGETLSLLKDAQTRGIDELAKAYTQPASSTTGLTSYALEAPAKRLVPVITPLRNSIPRLMGVGGTAINWRAITGINIGNMSPGVSQGNRGGVIAQSTADYTAAYRTIGFENYVTFEADLAAEGFQDLRSTAALDGLQSLMIGEEFLLLGGNTSLALGTTPTPTVTDTTTGGVLAFNTAFSVICVALTLDGYRGSSLANGVVALVTRTNADGTTDTYGGGSAQKSVAGTVTTANDAANTHRLSVSVAWVAGAVGYAWFAGSSGSERLQAITTINSAILGTTAFSTTSQLASALPASDNSTNNLVYDGMITIANKAGSNSYLKVLATGTPGTGTGLTSDGAGGIVEIDTALQSFWDNYRLSPTQILVNSQEQKNIYAKILGSGTNAALRPVVVTDAGAAVGSGMVRSYLNKFAMGGAVEIPIRLHPNVPPGTIFFDSETIPYPLSNVTAVRVLRCRRDYYQLEWPLRTRKYEYGVYADCVFQHYFPPSLGFISNIADR